MSSERYDSKLPSSTGNKFDYLQQLTPVSTNVQLGSLTYDHYAIIYTDHNGKVRVQTSPSIANSCQTIMSPFVMENFLEAVTRSNKDTLSRSSNTLHESHPARARSPLSPQSLMVGEANDVTGHDYAKVSEIRDTAEQLRTEHGRYAKRKKVFQECVVPMNITCHHQAMLPLRDRRLLRKYYQKAFESLQQINCRTLAKAYLKLVEPRKQVNYPYNGRKLIAGISRQLDPEMTRPDWWPLGVTHREPDHLPKAERVRLLVHILCELRDSRGITVAKLREADQSIRRQITPPERLQVLDEIYRVREEEESYLDGRLNHQAAVYISQAHLPDEIDPKDASSPMTEGMNADVNPVHKRERLDMESHTSVFPSTGAFFISHTNTPSRKGDNGVPANLDSCPSAALPTPRIPKEVHEGEHPFSVSLPSAPIFHHSPPAVPLSAQVFPLRFYHEPNVSHGQQDQPGPNLGVPGHGIESCANPYYFNF